MSHSTTTNSLQSRLASSLPSPVKLTFHHVVSGPCDCPEVFAAAPGEIPESTISESHLLSASIQHEGQWLQVFALEVYVYATATLNIIFVSKADSTGYLHLLEIPKGTPSPIQITITTFLEWLVGEKKRKDARLLLSLFARAQNQYLFPGSVENKGKHVLDDRGLIRWWCRVLDPVLSGHATLVADIDYVAHAYLVVPGLDTYEMRPYLPKSSTVGAGPNSRWSTKDPLKGIGKPGDLPVRCYIPRFPDDPKARFVIDLDDELPEEDESDLIRKGRSPGIWKSVKTLAEFWELMAFRQECSAGRLVGFIWAVFEPAGLVGKPLQAVLTVEREDPALPTPRESQNQSSESAQSFESSYLGPIGSPTKPLPTPIPSSQHQPDESVTEKANGLEDSVMQPSIPVTEGKRINTGVQLNSEAYKKVLLLLDSLDYSNLKLALESTAKFVQAVTTEVDNSPAWEFEVKGEKTAYTKTCDHAQSSNTANDGTTAVKGAVNVLNANVVRSRKRPIEDAAPAAVEQKQPEVRVLSASSIRKKPKPE